MRPYVRSVKMTVFAILLSWAASSQKPLLVGDTIPVSVFSLTNEGGGSVRLPDKSKKLILLDLWATNCVTCINNVPKMEKLQEQFKEDIQIILVNPETADSTRKFLKRKGLTSSKASLPMISGSALLAALIPFDYVPWYVWIDQQGIVRFITDGYNATGENISRFIKTGTGTMSQIYAAALFDDRDIEQKAIESAGAKRAQYYSFLSKKMPGRAWDPPSPATGYVSFGSKGSIIDLFRDAFSEKTKRDLNARGSILLEVSNPEDYLSPKNPAGRDSFYRDHLYNYFLMLPESRTDELYSFAQQELCRQFNVSASMEKRLVECYALVATGKGKDFRMYTDSALKIKSKDSISYVSKPITELLRNIREQFVFKGVSQPVINATGYTSKICVTILRASFFPLQFDLFKKELNAYGLDLLKMYTYAEVLVLKEKENK